MRTSLLALQSVVVVAIAALVTVAHSRRGGAQSLAPAAPAAALVEAEREEAPVGGPTRHFVRIVDRDTGVPVPYATIDRMPANDTPYPMRVAVSDEAGLAELTVDAGQRPVFAVWGVDRVTAPITFGDASTPRQRPRVVHLARAGSVRGVVLDFAAPSGAARPRHVALVIPLLGESPADDSPAPSARHSASVSGVVIVPRDAREAAASARSLVLHAALDDAGQFELTGVPVELDGLALRFQTLGGRNRWGPLCLEPFRVGEVRELVLAMEGTFQHASASYTPTAAEVAGEAYWLDVRVTIHNQLPTATFWLQGVAAGVVRGCAVDGQHTYTLGPFPVSDPSAPIELVAHPMTSLHSRVEIQPTVVPVGPGVAHVGAYVSLR